MAGTQTIRLKSKHNRSRKVRLTKTITAFVLVGGIVTGLYLFGSSKVFALKEVAFQGNHYLTDQNLRQLGGIEDGENLFALSTGQKASRLIGSPWIKEVSIRKDFPRGLMVKITEAAPRAILRSKDKMLLVDTEGTVLEELQGKRDFFLPVIVGSGAERGRSFQEALTLAGVIREKGLMSAANRVEITGYERGVEEIALSIDGLLVMVGEGKYEEKLDMLIELAEEIKARMSDIDYYVDMRFDDRVVVKPINTSGKRTVSRGGA